MGLSTGVLVDAWGDWPELVRRAADVSPYAVELSALSGTELPGLTEYLRSSPRLPFRYVSVHAPSKDPSGDEAELLGRLPLWVRSIVVHPDVLPSDLTPYRRLGSRLLIENMDARKTEGQSVAELAEIFTELPDAGFCLDVAHSWSLDHSAEQHLSHDLLDAFRRRLRHVHLSSLDEDGQHVELSLEHEELFAPVLDRCRDVPWILEASPPLRWS
ncbi:MAG: TIM barrel protein [Solirubrobacterales bacterium]|nr:TIM barrel protein [Solirubrobacterales bacterium]